MINYRRQHARNQALAKRKDDLAGKGSYLFENNTRGTLNLPRPTKDGVSFVRLGGQFIGDSYYMLLVKTGDIRLVKNLEEAPTAEKLYVYKNFNNDETRLPEANRDGQIIISPTAEFVGDNRFFPLLKTGRLKLVREVEQYMPQQEKLITEQPPMVTNQGTVEFVKVNGDQLNEEEKKKKEKLLAEDPLNGVKLLLD